MDFDRTNTLGAYLITPSMGSHFVMYLAKMQGAFGEFTAFQLWTEMIGFAKIIS